MLIMIPINESCIINASPVGKAVKQTLLFHHAVPLTKGQPAQATKQPRNQLLKQRTSLAFCGKEQTMQEIAIVGCNCAERNETWIVLILFFASLAEINKGKGQLVSVGTDARNSIISPLPCTVKFCVWLWCKRWDRTWKWSYVQSYVSLWSPIIRK